MNSIWEILKALGKSKGGKRALIGAGGLGVGIPVVNSFMSQEDEESMTRPERYGYDFSMDNVEETDDYYNQPGFQIPFGAVPAQAKLPGPAQVSAPDMSAEQAFLAANQPGGYSPLEAPPAVELANIDPEAVAAMQQALASNVPQAPDEEMMKRDRLIAALQGLAGGAARGRNLSQMLAMGGAGAAAGYRGSLGDTEQARADYATAQQQQAMSMAGFGMKQAMSEQELINQQAEMEQAQAMRMMQMNASREAQAGRMDQGWVNQMAGSLGQEEMMAARAATEQSALNQANQMQQFAQQQEYFNQMAPTAEIVGGNLLRQTVDPDTGEITLSADPLPQMRQGDDGLRGSSVPFDMLPGNIQTQQIRQGRMQDAIRTGDQVAAFTVAAEEIMSDPERVYTPEQIDAFATDARNQARTHPGFNEMASKDQAVYLRRLVEKRIQNDLLNSPENMQRASKFFPSVKAFWAKWGTKKKEPTGISELIRKWGSK